MKGRIVAILAVTGAMLFALSVGRVIAASDTESCKSTTIDQTNTNADGTECQTMVNGLGPNKATAKASGLSKAVAEATNGAVSSANASQNSQAVCHVSAGIANATSKGSGAQAVVDISPVGGGKAKATGPHSMAVSTISNVSIMAGGSVNSTASGGATAVTNVDATNGGSAGANAKAGSTAVATVTFAGGGNSKATSSGAHAQAVSTAEIDCKSTTTAKGANSTAVATCQDSGSVVTAEATNGSTAVGSDTAAPVCTPMNGGKAQVRSPMGNCSL